MSQTTKDRTCCTSSEPCAPLPEPVRMNYFHGQLISERDLRTEQTYFREKLRHHHRCIHGYGVLCGLEVSAVPTTGDCADEPEDDHSELREEIRKREEQLARLEEEVAAGKMSKDEAQERGAKLKAELEELYRKLEDKGGSPNATPRQRSLMVDVSCGAAVDCDGNDLILGESARIDLVQALCGKDRARLLDQGGGVLYLSICYQECGREPTRPLAMDSCATTNACRDARVAEGVRLTVSFDPPTEDERCNTCCDACEDACLLLAAIRVEKGRPFDDRSIDHSVRRRFGLYDPTVITGISWRHGKTYSPSEANAILGTKDENGGIEIRFSRPIHVDTLQPGVIDLVRVTGGRGLAGAMIAMEGEFVGIPDDAEFVDSVRYRDATDETVQEGDRIMIVVRAPFLLDKCCRPVEGLHAGGRVPLIEKSDSDEASPSVEASTEEEIRRRKEAELRAAKAKAEAAARKDEKAEELDVIVVTGSRRVCDSPPWGPGPWTSSQPGNFESWFFVGEE